VSWDQRTLPEQNSYARTGLPYEVFFDLRNELHASPWLSVPLRVNYDFICQLAKLAKERVAPGVPIYVEWVNEPWNSANESQSDLFMRDLARRLDVGGSGREATMRAYVLRSQQVLDIFAEVFADQPQRLVRVIQMPNELGDLLDFRETWKHIDAIAIITYFGYPISKLVAKPWVDISDEEIEAFLAATIENIIKPRIIAASALARKRNLRLVAYEGNHHLSAYGSGVKAEEKAAFNAARTRFINSPRIAALITRMLDIWFQNGGGLFCYWHFSGEVWGLYPEQLDAPLAKNHTTRTILDYIDSSTVPPAESFKP
jgi:hypothetical protein